MKKHKKRRRPSISGEALMESSEAIESGYHPPSQQDIRDIRHDHNTAAPGSITADEAVRRDVA